MSTTIINLKDLINIIINRTVSSEFTSHTFLTDGLEQNFDSIANGTNVTEIATINQTLTGDVDWSEIPDNANITSLDLRVYIKFITDSFIVTPDDNFDVNYHGSFLTTGSSQGATKSDTQSTSPISGYNNGEVITVNVYDFSPDGVDKTTFLALATNWTSEAYVIISLRDTGIPTNYSGDFLVDIGELIDPSTLTATWTADGFVFTGSGGVDVSGEADVVSSGMPDISIIGSGGVTVSGTALANLSVDVSGIYLITPGKTNDTLYARDTSTETIDVAIPNPFFETAKIGY